MLFIIKVNNAGIARFKNTVDTTEESYDQLMGLNVRAHFFVSQLAIPHLKETKGWR